MKEKKYLVLIEDDCEVMGNGRGNVLEHQFIPSIMLMNLAKKFDIQMTFMVDVAHQLTLKKYLHDPKVRIQSEVWDEMILLMKAEGFDVQLHLHPQWFDAVYDSGDFILDKNWNIGRCEEDVQEKLIRDSVLYLENILKPKHPDYAVKAFKAGSWGMQPSYNLLQIFEELKINILMGPRDGMVLPHWGVHYEELEEKNLPYCPDFSDISRVSKKHSDLCVLPLQVYEPSLPILAKLAFDTLLKRSVIKNEIKYFHHPSTPEGVKSRSGSIRNFLKPGLRPYRTHLKIGSQPFSFLRDAFDSVMARLDSMSVPRIPIVIESHTKQYRNNFSEIEKFFGYISDNYSDTVDFGDMSMLAVEIAQGDIAITSHSELGSGL